MTGHVYIVEDDDAFRASLTEIIDSVGFTYDAWKDPESLMVTQKLRRPGCVVLDYRLPALSGLEVIKIIRNTSTIPMILISAYADVRITMSAVRAGAVGVFEKPLDDNEFLGFLEKICFEDRHRIQNQEVCRRIQEMLRSLSETEKAVLDLMVEGCPNKVIAKDLGKSVKAIERNRQSLIRKLKCQTANEALSKVVRCPMMPASPLKCLPGVCGGCAASAID